MELGNKIKSIRKSQHLTQRELCCEILNRSTMCKIENNIIKPSLAQLEHIAEVLNTPMAVLLDPNTDGPSHLITDKENESKIKKLFEKKKYLDIIEASMSTSFESCFYKGMSYYYENLMDKAYNYLVQCESYFSKMEESNKYINAERLCIALNSLRKCNLDTSPDASNIKYLKKILNYIDSYNCKHCEIYDITINNTGVYYMNKNDYSTALSILEDYLNNKTKPYFLDVTAIIHLNMSIICFSLRYYEKATDHIKKAIFFFNYMGKLEDEEECYINLFNCYLYTREFKQCENLISYLKKRYLGSKLYETFKLLETTLYYNMKEENLFFSSMKKMNYSDLRNKSRMDYYFLKGKYNFLQGNFDKSERNYKKCISYLNSNNRFLDASVVYKDLAEIDNTTDYLEAYENALTKYRSLEYTPARPDITLPDSILKEVESHEPDRLHH